MVAAVTVPLAVPDQLETLRHLLNRYPRSWQVCYSAYWQECQHRSPLRHQDRDYRDGDLAAALASGCVGCGLAGAIWDTVVCFSCGKSGHGEGRCPELNETFPFMLPGWTAEKVGGNYVMVSPCVAAERRRALKTKTDPGRGVSRPDQ